MTYRSEPSARRLVIVAAIVGFVVTALVFVPAAARAAQRLQFGPAHAAGSIGFHKSANNPPDRNAFVVEPAVAAPVEPPRASGALIGHIDIDRRIPILIQNGAALRAPPKTVVA